MREGRSTFSSCGDGEEYIEYRGWRERQTYGSLRTSNRNGHWSQGCQPKARGESRRDGR